VTAIGSWLLEVLTSSVVVSVIVGLVIWALREWISTRLTASVRLETEQKLTSFRMRLDSAERQFSAVRQAGIEAARSTSAAALVERVIAIKEIARVVSEWSSISTLSMIVAAMTSAIAERGAADSSMHDALPKMLKAARAQERLDRIHLLASHRPFLTERTWALFAAFQGFYVTRVGKAMCILTGNAELVRRIWAVDGDRKIVSTVAPQMLDAYDRNPVEIESSFLETLREQLLAEMQRSLSGEHSGPDAVRQAATIASTADQVIRDLQREEQKADMPDLSGTAVTLRQ
jgi:hypothetical protein